jgi:hypothetical protein
VVVVVVKSLLLYVVRRAVPAFELAAVLRATFHPKGPELLWLFLFLFLFVSCLAAGSCKKASCPAGWWLSGEPAETCVGSTGPQQLSSPLLFCSAVACLSSVVLTVILPCFNFVLILFLAVLRPQPTTVWLACAVLLRVASSLLPSSASLS